MAGVSEADALKRIAAVLDLTADDKSDLAAMETTWNHLKGVMAAQRRSAKVQAEGCWALTYLAYQNADICSILLRGEAAITTIHAALDAFVDDFEVQRYGCRAVYTLARDAKPGERQAVIAGGDTHAKLERAKKTHSDNEDYNSVADWAERAQAVLRDMANPVK